MPAETSARPWVLLAVAVVLPAVLYFAVRAIPAAGGPPSLHESPVATFPPSSLPFEAVTISPVVGQPRITHVQIFDLDRDGRVEVIAADGQRNRLFAYHRGMNDVWNERPVGPELNCPGPFAIADFDNDGDLDLIVSVIGSIWPTDDRVGQVVWLENRGGEFVRHVLLDDVRRVTDVRTGDLDGDGDLDISVAEYGFNRGRVLWLENRGGRFRDHVLFASQGPSHVPIVDLDADGDLDIVALVSQDHEEVWAFVNDGKAAFAPRKLHGFLNYDLGSAGLTVADLDRDGDADLILSAGDNLEVGHHYPQAWHGCFWLENKGNLQFEAHRVATVGGVYAAATADFDADGDTDIVLACMFNDWRNDKAASLVLLVNDGRQTFTATTLAEKPVALATIAAGDLDGDGRPDVVAGSLNLEPIPPGKLGCLTAWFNRKAGRP